jgi:hypothetical protein
MNAKEEKLLREFCSHLLLDYGFEFLPSDPVLPALYAIHCELNGNADGNKKVAHAINEALEKLNPTVYNFSERGEGWKFQIAGSLRWLFMGLTVMGAIWPCVFWWRQYHDVVKARIILNTAAPLNQLLLNNVGKDKEGYLFLQFNEAKGNSIEFYTEYDKRQDGSVRVYLGKLK